MGKLSKKVSEKIKKDKIKPTPKWRFILRSGLIWVLFVINLIFGSLGVAIIIYLITNNDAISDFALAKNLWQWIFLSIPIAWIVLTLFFLIIAYIYFKSTEEGYRFTAIRIFLLNIIVTLICGSIIYTSGFSEKVNDLFSESIPFYTHTLDTRARIWMRPEEGYLSGNIDGINKSRMNMILIDLEGKKWSIDYSNSLVKPSVNLEVGEKIKILGEEEKNTFIAKEIRPWSGKGRRMQEN